MRGPPYDFCDADSDCAAGDFCTSPVVAGPAQAATLLADVEPGDPFTVDALCTVVDSAAKPGYTADRIIVKKETIPDGYSQQEFTFAAAFDNGICTAAGVSAARCTGIGTGSCDTLPFSLVDGGSNDSGPLVPPGPYVVAEQPPPQGGDAGERHVHQRQRDAGRHLG